MTTSPAPMTEAAGPHYAPGLPTASTDVTVPKHTPMTLGRLRALVHQADSIRLAPGAVVSYTASMGGKLTGLKVTGDVLPDANEPLTGP